MSYTYLQGQGEVSSVASFSDIPVSVLSSGIHTHGASCSLANVTGCYRVSRSGTTFRRSMERHGAVASMSCAAVSRVRTYPQRARGQGLTAKGRECGDTWPASLARYDRATSSWRTAQSSLLGGLESFSETWPRWGTMRSGVCWELPTLGRHTDASESGSLLPTPLASNTKAVHLRSGGRPALSYLPTPRAEDHKGARTSTDCTARRLQNGQANLSEWVVESLRMWPTPVADGDRRTNYAQGGTSLGFAVRMWPTPTAQDAKNNGAPSQMERNTKPLNAEVGGPLNPTWVEWLIGWPLGWTDCAVSATDRYRPWLRSHGRR
jgi:DNA (cytosine-5)-methyltransferase 1